MFGSKSDTEKQTTYVDAQIGTTGATTVHEPSTQATPDKQTKQLKALNKIKVASKFNGTLAVDVFIVDQRVVVTYVSPLGPIGTKTFTNNFTAMNLATTINDLVFAAHEEGKDKVQKNGNKLILKTISNSKAAASLKNQVQASQADVKIAQNYLDETAAAVKEIDQLILYKQQQQTDLEEDIENLKLVSN